MPAIADSNRTDNMDCYTLIILVSLAMVASGWPFPFYPVYRVPQIRVTRFAPIPRPHRLPIRPQPYVRYPEKPKPERPKHDYDDYEEDDYEDDDHTRTDDHNQNHNDHNHNNNDHNHNNDHKGSTGVIGPVHTFVKTDKNANYKWGVRHHVGKKHPS